MEGLQRARDARNKFSVAYRTTPIDLTLQKIDKLAGPSSSIPTGDRLKLKLYLINTIIAAAIGNPASQTIRLKAVSLAAKHGIKNGVLLDSIQDDIRGLYNAVRSLSGEFVLPPDVILYPK